MEISENYSKEHLNFLRIWRLYAKLCKMLNPALKASKYPREFSKFLNIDRVAIEKLDKNTITEYKRFFKIYHDKIWEQDECASIAQFFDIEERLEDIKKIDNRDNIVSANNSYDTVGCEKLITYLKRNQMTDIDKPLTHKNNSRCQKLISVVENLRDFTGIFQGWDQIAYGTLQHRKSFVCLKENNG